MANFDLIVNVIDKYVSTHIGHRSRYSTAKTVSFAHPGTESKIKGWEWGRTRWPGYEELSNYSHIPSLFDSGYNIPSRYYQSGYGYDTDLLLKEISIIKGVGKNIWSPQILSGNYYVYNKEWYLFSDQYITETLIPVSHSITRPKNIAPIFVRRFKREENTSALKVAKELTKTTDDPPAEGEFFLNVFDPDDIKLETSNLSISTQIKTFAVTAETTAILLETFPVNLISIEADGVIKYDGTIFTSDWNADEDVGHVKLPEAHGAASVVVQYQEVFSVQYEPYFSKGEVSGVSANVNPLYSGVNKGFVQITTEILEPYEITIVADLPVVSSGDSSLYNLQLGNNVGKLTATVKNKAGTLLEGVRVYFDWELTNDLSSITNHNGQALMYYNSPATIEEIGSYFLQSNLDFNTATVLFDIAAPPENTPLSSIWIFALYHTDPFFGLKADTDPNNGSDSHYVDKYYEDYLAGEGTTYSAEEQAKEIAYRDLNFISLNNPAKPESIESMSSPERQGQKRLIMEEIAVAPYLNPNTGVEASGSDKVWWPVAPTSITSTQVVYDVDSLPDASDREKINSYFIVSNKVQTIKAYAYNSAGEKIWSNTIQIQISLPDSVNGTYHSASLADPYVSNLIRALFPLPARATDNDSSYPGFYSLGTTADNASNGTPDFVSLNQGQEARIPIGFRIKTPNSGITVASLLEQVTFINPHGETEEPT